MGHVTIPTSNVIVHTCLCQDKIQATQPRVAGLFEFTVCQKPPETPENPGIPRRLMERRLDQRRKLWIGLLTFEQPIASPMPNGIEQTGIISDQKI